MLLRKIIGENLKEYRKRINLSQHDVADKTGMEQKTISKIENYLENIGVDKLDQLCKGLGIHSYELVVNPEEITVRALLEQKVFVKGIIFMLYQYYLQMSTVFNEEISSQPLQTYGIGIKDGCMPCIEDICTDKAFVESLVNLCNIHQVSPDHLIDVIEDALFESKL